MNTTDIDSSIGESSSSSTPTTSLNHAQETTIAFVPIVPSVLSIVASLCVMRLVHKRGYDSPARRFLFGLSVYDILNSINAVLQSFLIPQSTSRRLYAIGNDATCDVLGFFFQFNQGSYLYFAALSLYYVLVVKFGWKDQLFARRIEPFLHIFIVAFPLITGILGLVWDQYGEVTIGAGCWLQPTPRCDADCISSLEFIFSGGPFMGCLVIVILSNLILFCHVRNTIYQGIKRSQARLRESMANPTTTLASHHHSSSEGMDGSHRTELPPSSSKQMNQHMEQYSQEQVARVKRVGTQSALYCLVYIVTYIWTIVLRLVSNSGGGSEQESDLFVFMVLRAIFLPGMGVGTLLVYVRPRYMALRQTGKETSRWSALKQVIWNDEEASSKVSRSKDGSSGIRSSEQEEPKKPESFLAKRIAGVWSK